MLRAVHVRILLAVGLLLFLLGGCGESASPTPVAMANSHCNFDAECPAGFCIDNSCSPRCTTDADCKATKGRVACGVNSLGQRSCMEGCDAFSSEVVCVDGVPTACAVAPPEYCGQCGCPSTQRCEIGQGCEPRRAAGEPCESDRDCNTSNCSTFAGVCRVAVGAACNIAICDKCLSGPNFSYCSRECGSDLECGSGFCLGNNDNFYCRPPCSSLNDPSCPGQECQINDLSGTRMLYCDCVYAGTCGSYSAPHPLGSECRDDRECESGGSCDSVIVASDSLFGEARRGLCSKPCGNSTECGSGFACAAVGEAHCLPTCDGACTTGTCVGLPTTEGATQNVCWVKKGNSGACWEPTDCQSGNCISARCAPAGGQANGAACGASDDCQSKSCIAGHCRGNAVLGEACSKSVDCAVGTCCTSGKLANTCATTCE